MLDSHCHLVHMFTIPEFTQYINKHQFFSHLINISTNLDEHLIFSKLTLPSYIYSAVGLYPEFAETFSSSLLNDFRKLIEQYPPHLIGEIGLDYHWDYGSPKQQQDLFTAQIELAVEKKLPLIIHSRDAFVDTYQILKDYAGSVPIIMHCFGYGPEEAEKFLDLGVFLSFAGNLTFKNAEPLRQAARITPTTRLLLETDAPYLAPVPKRGKQNFPHYVKHTYEFMAELKKMEFSDLEKSVEQNMDAVLGD